MIFTKGMTLQEFERINNLDLYRLFEKDIEGTNTEADDPDAFVERLEYNSEEIYNKAKQG